MPSNDSSTKLASAAGDGYAPSPSQKAHRDGDSRVRTVEEFVEFLAALEAVFGPDDRPRPPTIGHRFLL